MKVLVPEAINIWVGLPMEGKWNGSYGAFGMKSPGVANKDLWVNFQCVVTKYVR